MILHSNIIGKGKPLIILHGFLGMSDNWKTVSKQLAELDYKVHIVDQRNHGRSFHDPVFNYDVMAEDLKAYMAHHDVSETALLGHSMGGKTAMFFATKYQKLVSKLIIADISPRYYPVHHDAILNGLNQLNTLVLESRSEADEVLSKYISELGVRQFLLKNLYWKSKGQLALRLNLEVLTQFVENVGEALPLQAKFNKPTLFLRGDRSEYINDQDLPLINQHFPEAKLVTLANAGHWLHAENPDDFLKAVSQFLNSN